MRLNNSSTRVFLYKPNPAIRRLPKLEISLHFPCADTERWQNEQDCHSTQAESLEIKAYDIALAAISSRQAS
jgi:hypothetical protein